MPTGHADRLLPAVRRVLLVRETAARTDGQLLAAFVRDRDADAFAGLVRRHGPMVLGVCRRVVGDDHAAEDAFQAVFLVLARRAAAVRPREQVANWLYGVAYRTAIKARMVLARRRSREKQVDTMPEPPARPPADPWTDLHPVIDEELARLPDKLRVPVVLCDLEGRPQRAVATHLGIAPATLASRLSSARRQLASRLTRRGVTLSGGALAVMLGERASAAAVAPGLAATAVQAAEAVAAGAGVAGLMSAQAVHLCEGVLRMMLISKLKAVGAGAVAVLALTGGLGFGLVPARAGDEPGTGQGAPRPAEPRPTVRAQPAKPVDDQLLEGLKALGVKPADSIDDATFLRRLFLDLSGTLPTAVETSYFVADSDAKKRRKIVFWLLADDRVRKQLAVTLGIPVERIRLRWVADEKIRKLYRTTVVQDETVRTATQVAGKAVVAMAGLADHRPTTIAMSRDGFAFFGDFDANAGYDQLFLSENKLALQDVWGSLMVTGPGEIVFKERGFDLLVQVDPPAAEKVDPPKPGSQNPAQPTKPQPQDPNEGTGVLRFWLGDPKLKTQTTGTVDFIVRDTDEDFIARVVQQARGTPPTSVEKKYFLEDKDPKKREKLLDLLLLDPVVAKKLGDDWKKKALSPTTTTVRMLQSHQLWDLGSTPTPLTRIRPTFAYEVKPASPAPQPDRLDQLVGELLGAKKTDEQVLEGVTLATIGRLPTDGEKQLALAAVSKAGDRKAAWVAVARALAASAEGKKHTAPAKPESNLQK